MTSDSPVVVLFDQFGNAVGVIQDEDGYYRLQTQNIIVDGYENGPVAVKPPNTPAVDSDPALVVAISPNNPIIANNSSVGATGSSPPADVTYIGGNVTTLSPVYTPGQLDALSLTTSGALRVDGSAVTQPVSGTVSATQNGTWAVLVDGYVQTNPDVFVTNFPAVQPVSGTITVDQGTSPWEVQDSLAEFYLDSILANQTNGTQVTTVDGYVQISGIVTVDQGTSPWIVQDSLAESYLSSILANQTNGAQITTIDGYVQTNPNVYVENFPAVQTVNGTVTANQGTANTLANAWPVEITDGTNVLGTVAHPIQVNVDGYVQTNPDVIITNFPSTQAVTQSTSPWVDNITQFGGNNVVTGTGASGAGIPRVTVSNDSNILATQSGIWTVQQGTPPWTVQGDAASGSAVAGNPVLVGGSDGTDARALSTDTSGHAIIVGDGVAGTPAGGVVSVQGVSGGTAIPVSGTVTNASVGSNGAAAPTSSTQAGGVYDTTSPVPTNGQLEPLQIDQAGNLLTFPGVEFITGAAWTSSTASNTVQYQTGTTTIGQLLGAAAVVVQLDMTTTLTGGAVTFQGTFDNVNWVTIPAAQVLNPNTFAQVSNPYSFVASTQQPILILLQGYLAVRAQLTTVISGTGSVTPYWSTRGTLGSISLAKSDISFAPIVINVIDSGSTFTGGYTLNIPQFVVTGTATVGSYASYAVGSHSTIFFEISGSPPFGTGWQGTLIPELSVDGGTSWVVTTAYASGLRQYVTEFKTTTDIGTIIFGSVDVAGATNFRLRASTDPWSGTAQITAVLSNNQQQLQTITAGGALPIGTTLSSVHGLNTTYPVMVGGLDSTSTVRQFQTDTSGNQIIVGDGVAGTPAGGVVSVQGVSGGVPLAADNTATGTFTGGGGIGQSVQVAMSGLAGAAVTCEIGTFGTNISADYSADGGTTWTQTNFYDTRGQEFVFFTVSSGTAISYSIVVPGGASHVRVRNTTSGGGGSVVVNLRATIANYQTSSFAIGVNTLLPSGSTVPLTLAAVGGLTSNTSVPIYSANVVETFTLTQSGAMLVGGVDGSNSPHNLSTDTSGHAIIVGDGTAGSPAGGVVSVQGVSGGTAIPATVTNATASNLLAEVGGLGAAGSAATGNPVQIGGVFQNTSPAPATGNLEPLQLDSAGNLLTMPGSEFITGTAWSSATSGGTVQYQNGTSTIGQLLGATAVVIQLDQTTTLTGGAVTFQGTYDGTNWVTIPNNQVVNPNTFAPIANPYSFVANTNQAFVILLQGYLAVRINLSVTITGTGTITPYWSTRGLSPLAGSLALITDGSVTAGIGNGRLQTGDRTPLFWEFFTSINESVDYDKWTFATAGGMTIASGSNGLDFGAMTFNNGASTSTGSCLMTSVKNFASYQDFPLYFSADVFIDNSITGTAFRFGFGAPSSGSSNPPEGVYFSLVSATIDGATRYKGENSTNNVISTSFPNSFYGKFTIMVTDAYIKFTITNLQTNTLFSSNIFPNNNNASKAWALHIPIFFSTAVTGSPGSAPQLEVYNVSVSQMELTTNRSWPQQLASAGYSAILDQNTFVQSANYTNNTVPSSATLSNTAASYTTLGGLFQFAAVAGAETDYALFAYLVPLDNTISSTGKDLIVYSIKIDSFITGAASSTTPTILQWAVGINSTGVSLAVGGNTPPIITPIGMQQTSATAAIGTNFSPGPVLYQPTTPLVIHPNRYLHIILRIPVSNNTSNQIIRGYISIDGVFDA